MASIFALITSVILVSCPPVEEPKSAEITNVELISTGGKIFSLGNNSLLNVKAVAEVENEKDDTEIVFEWQLLRDDNINITSVISPSYNSVKVDIDKLNTLGDYTLKCFTYLKGDEKNITESEFVFTVNTDEILKNSLNYSFSNTDNIDLNLSESGAVLNKINKEWAYNRKVITSKTDRPIVSGTIPFEVGNDDVLILSFKDNDIVNKFGELSIDTDEVNTSYIYSNGYLLYFPNRMEEEQTEKEVNLKIKAGSKQEITIPVKITKASTENINLPEISVFTPYGKSGGRITITGDKVSTTYRPIEEGYKLNTTIYRTYRIVKGNDDLLSDMITISQTKVLNEDDYKTNEDMCYYIEKENAIEYYFPYAGTYYIECFLITPLGNTQKVHYSFVIEPQILDSSTYSKTDLNVSYVSLLNNSKYRNQTANKYIDKNDIQDRVRITPNISNDKPLFYVLTYEPTAPLYYGEEALMFNEEEVKTNVNYFYKMAGNYTVYFHTYDNGNGSGNIPHDSEELEYYLDKNNYGARTSFIIENLNEDEEDFSKWLTITNRKVNDDNTTTYTFVANDYLINKYETLYIGLFYGNSMDEMIINSSNKTFTITRPSSVGYTQISIIYENKKVLSMTHSFVNYTQSLTNIRVINLSDSEQDRYNERKFRLSLTGLSSGDKVYYRLNGQTAWTSYTSGQNIYGRQEQSYIDIKVVQNGKTESEAIFIKDSFKIQKTIEARLCIVADSQQDSFEKRKYYIDYPDISGETVYSTVASSSNISSFSSRYITSTNDKQYFYVIGDNATLTIKTRRYGYTDNIIIFTKNSNPGKPYYRYPLSGHGLYAKLILPDCQTVSIACWYNNSVAIHRMYGIYNRTGQKMRVELITMQVPIENKDPVVIDPLKEGVLVNPYQIYYGMYLDPCDKEHSTMFLNLAWSAAIGYDFHGYGLGSNGRYSTFYFVFKCSQNGYKTQYYTTFLKDLGKYGWKYPDVGIWQGKNGTGTSGSWNVGDDYIILTKGLLSIDSAIKAQTYTY